jgi:hypothetical protein
VLTGLVLLARRRGLPVPGDLLLAPPSRTPPPRG